MSEPLIKIEGLSKKFCKDLKRSLRYGLSDIGRELVGAEQEHRQLLREGEFWVLRDINLELRRGECLALLGKNGSGKSTLLKLINGLLKPDAGLIEVKGKLGALIELGAGFNPVLTGRENIAINAAILGFTSDEVKEYTDQIIEFSELRDFIDTPVQYYSSGMRVRLGFSIAVFMKPDVLLIDEVLAVGDVGFKNKSYNAIQKLIKNTAVIFVSHSVTQVAKVCNRGIVLRNGLIKFQSSRVEEIVDSYFEEFETNNPLTISGSNEASLLKLSIQTPGTSYDFDFTDVANSPKDLVTLKYGDPVSISCYLKLDPKVTNFDMGFSFWDMENKSVAQCFSVNSSVIFENSDDGEVLVSLELPEINLSQGRYFVGFGVYSRIREANTTQDLQGRILFAAKNLLDISVTSNKPLYGGAPLQLTGAWQQGKK